MSVAYGASFLQCRSEILSGQAAGIAGDVLRCSDGDYFSALVTTFRSQIDDPIGGLDHIQIVFDDNDRVAAIDQLMEEMEQNPNVFEMQAGRGFIQNVKGLARCDLGKLSS